MLVNSVSPTRRFRLFSRSWLAVAVGLLLTKAALSVTVRQSVTLTAYTLITYFLALVLAAGIATLNAVQSSEAIRLFWSFLAMAFGAWSLNVWSWIYYVLVLGRDRPPSLGLSVPLVLHIVFIIAAVASRPHLKLSPHRAYRTTLNFLLLLFFWVFAYAFLWVPHWYTGWNVGFLLRGQALYLAENFLLFVVLGILIFRAQPPWSSIYWHLLGASVLYILGSSIANYLLAYRGVYVGLKDIPYMAAAYWFGWVALRGRELALQLAQFVQPDTSDTNYASLLAMLSVVAIPVVGVWELFRVDEPYRTRVIRLLIVLLSVLFLAVFAFTKEYLANRELASDVGLAKEEYRRIIETTNEGVWLLDSKLHTSYVNRQMAEMLGYEPGEMLGRSVFDFYFSEDIEHKEQVLKRRQQGLREQIEERLRRKDGLELWARMAATPICKDDGEFEGAMAMVSDITERRRAEEALQKSEARFRLAAQAGKMFAYEWDAVTDVIVRSGESTQILGIDDTAITTGEQIQTNVYPDDRERLKAAVAELSPEKPYLQISYRIVRRDGSVIWVERNSRAYFDEQGRMVRIIGMVADITERKLAEAALSTVSRRLIEAQEKERTRIARELHDDIGQRLALLTIELERLQENSPDLPVEVRSRMGELQKQTSEMATDIQTLSHELHSAKLEYLGLAAAMRGFCKEFGEQQKVEIDFQTHDLPSPLPPDTSLCFFRVLQEAVHNSAKHSGVRHFEVRLWGTPDEVHLTVRDSGTGFDREGAKRSRGLGLISMEERLKLLNGTLSIESQLKRGTTIHARVPFSSGGDSLRAAG